MYVYIQSEWHEFGGLWTVGFYDPAGEWQPESDHDDVDDAANRVHFLNGGENGLAERVEEMERQMAVVNNALVRIEK